MNGIIINPLPRERETAIVFPSGNFSSLMSEYNVTIALAIGLFLALSAEESIPRVFFADALYAFDFLAN